MSSGSRLGSESLVASAAISTCCLLPGDDDDDAWWDTGLRETAAVALSRADSDAVEPPCRNGLGR